MLIRQASVSSSHFVKCTETEIMRMLMKSVGQCKQKKKLICSELIWFIRMKNKRLSMDLIFISFFSLYAWDSKQHEPMSMLKVISNEKTKLLKVTINGEYHVLLSTHHLYACNKLTFHSNHLFHQVKRFFSCYEQLSNL